MARLSITGDGFSGSFVGLNKTTFATVDRKKVIKFATTVGVSSLTAAYGNNATALALSTYRASAVRCALDFSRPDVRLLPAFQQLETSEKANISYWMGMTFAAIAADELLHVAKLIHATKQSGIRKKNPRSRRLADLVGSASSHGSKTWHVIEAKGRNKSASPADRSDWKDQAKTIRSVKGTTVSTRSYCFGMMADPCTVELVDPPPEENSIDLRIPDDAFGAQYYAPYLSYLEDPTAREISVAGRQCVMRLAGVDPVDGDYFFLGLDLKVLKLARMQEYPDEVPEAATSDGYIGRDGVAVYTTHNPC